MIHPKQVDHLVFQQNLNDRSPELLATPASAALLSPLHYNVANVQCSFLHKRMQKEGKRLVLEMFARLAFLVRLLLDNYLPHDNHLLCLRVA